MSLIAVTDEMARALERLKRQAHEQQMLYHALITGVVALHQKHRVAKNYAISDELRTLLSDVGIEVIQGTAGHDYENIPRALQGRPVGDTWKLKRSDETRI